MSVHLRENNIGEGRQECHPSLDGGRQECHPSLDAGRQECHPSLDGGRQECHPSLDVGRQGCHPSLDGGRQGCHPSLDERFIVPVRDAEFGFGMWPWSRGPLWRITRPHRFTMEVNEFSQGYVIPAGYEFDKASIPPLFWGFPLNYTPDGLCTIPALEHDFLCDLLKGGSDWLRERLESADLVVPPAALVHEYFERRLLAEGVRRSKARTMGRAVRWFGPGGKFRRRLD